MSAMTRVVTENSKIGNAQNAGVLQSIAQRGAFLDAYATASEEDPSVPVYGYSET